MDAATLGADMDRVQVVDVRYPKEWEAGHIAGAVHIPLDYVLERFGELDPSRPVVTVGRSGSRSAEAAKDLASEGFDVENLEGGIEAWIAQGLPIKTDDGRPGRVADPEPPRDDRPADMQKFQNDFMEAALAMRDHFGDREPPEEEVLAFLRERDAGKTAGRDADPAP
jgi:rhodanese-related sulfurtransferase